MMSVISRFVREFQCSRYFKLIPTLFAASVIIVIAVFFVEESQLRSLSLILLFSSWLLVRFITNNSVIASIVLLLFAFPLNISFQIPKLASEAYVNGVFYNYLSPTIYLLDILVVILLLSLLFSYKKVKYFSKNLKILLFVILLYLAIHNAFFRELQVSFISTRYLLYVVAVVTGYVYRTKIFVLCLKYRNLLYSVFVSSMLFQLLVAFIQFKTGSSLGLGFIGESIVSVANVGVSSVSLDGNLHLRGYGTFQHPNILAGYFAFIFMFVVYKWLISNVISKVDKFIIVLAIFGIFLTFSQSSFLYTALVGVFLLFRWLYEKIIKNSRNKHVFGITLMLKDFILPESRSINERIDLIKSSLNYIKTYYISGVGLGNFVKYFHPFAPTGVAGITLNQPVHNIYILFLVENGIFFGGIILISYVVFVAISFIYNHNKSALLIVLLYLLVIGSLDHYLLTIPQGFLMFLLSFLFLNSNEWKFH